MKVYIAGPMRGISNFNKLAFDDAESLLKARGHETVNPWKEDAKNGIDLSSKTGDTNDIEGFDKNSLKEIIIKDIELVLGCDGIYLLSGHKQSKGATAEKFIADWAGLEVIE